MRLEIIPVRTIPDVRAGDDLASLILQALAREGLRLERNDILVVTQKVVSKAEGRVVPEQPDGKAAWVERETRRVVARRWDMVIAETRHGLVCANAGVDASNVEEGFLSLLPLDPDGTAGRIRAAVSTPAGIDVGVVITDTFGRPWRAGVLNVAIGCAGLPALVDLRGTKDATGRVLETTVVALADEIAAASGLVMGKADGVPVAVVRGLRAEGPPTPAATIVRRGEDDLFPTSPLEAIRTRLDARQFDRREVPSRLVDEAIEAAAAPPAKATGIFVPVSSSRLDLVGSGTDRETASVLNRSPVLILAFVERAHEVRAPSGSTLISGGMFVQNLLLALSAQGLACSWIPPEWVALEAAARLGPADGECLGAVVAGWPP